MSSNTLETLFINGIDLTEWEHVGSKDDYSYEGVSIPGLQQDVYCRFIEDEEISMGIFTFRGRPAYIAWGRRSDAHCGFHTPLSAENKILGARPGCPNITPRKDNDGHVVGFILDEIEVFV
ncbi:hypothetical protein FJY93_03755 [Candidatus Kaiserbacteria bacterium]|nr:hypothetical protein [Candidatus Kaiserbacteria bacterium]